MFDYIACVLAIIALYLNAKKIIWFWIVSMFCNISWLIHWYPKKEYPAIVISAVFFLINIYGFLQWKKKEK